MPVFSRKALRRSLGQVAIRDTFVGTTVLSLGANAAVAIMDRALSDPFFSASKYQGAWMLVASTQYRTASYNYQSGSVMSGQTAVVAIASGMDYELHEIISPQDKDRCIDDVILRGRVRREVAFDSTDGLQHYPLGAVASPHSVVEVLNAYYFADPTNSLNRQRHDFISKVPVQTATGLELRIDPPIASGSQLVLDAILTLSLGSGDEATINIPDLRMLRAGAAALAYDLLMAQTPGQQSDTYKQRRQDFAREFSRLSSINKPQVSRTIQFDTPITPMGAFWWRD